MTILTPTKKSQSVDQMMEAASKALVETDYFTCEELAVKALAQAFEKSDYERMSRILLPLQEARRQKRLAAIDTGKLTIMDAPVDLETHRVKPGCYLFQPPLVGADARGFRELADAQRVPAMVICREPKTQLGLWPVVMIGPVTVRVRIDPPAKEKATIQWLIEASEAMGDEAIESVDRGRELPHQIAALYDRLQTCREHEKLHQELADACTRAAHAASASE